MTKMRNGSGNHRRNAGNGSTFHTKHSLGQNFIEDEALLVRLADEAGITSHDFVLEIGPGMGTFTRQLAARTGGLLAIEIDRTLEPYLRVALEGYAHALVVFQDVMKADLHALIRAANPTNLTVRVAANLPYYITQDVLEKLYRELPEAESIAVMVQKEVAEKMLSAPRCEGYGPFALLSQLRYELRIACIVPADSFVPPPKVDSAFVMMTRRKSPICGDIDEKHLETVIRRSFLMRRKTLANNLASGFCMTRGQATELLGGLSMDERVRAEELTLEQFCALSIRMGEMLSEERSPE